MPVAEHPSAAEIESMRLRLEELEETLRALRNGEVDGIVVTGSAGDQVYTLLGAEHPYRVFVEEMREGALTIRSDGLVLFCNRRFANLLNVPMASLIGQTIGVIPSEEIRKALTALLAARESGSGRQDLTYTVEGEVRTLRVEATWLPAEACFAVLTTDVTDFRQREAELRRSNVELEHFARVAANDLQEPLRMVAHSTALLTERYRDRLDAEANDLIASAADGVHWMQQMIHALLDYSRAGARSRPLQVVSGNAALEEALILLRSSIEESAAIITSDELPEVLADEPQLIQLFQNLLANALKFQKPGLSPRVHVAAQRTGNEWIFSVQDSGIGIPRDAQSRLFVIFQRLHPRDEYPGIGVGLAICRRIIDRLRGRIWVDSEEGRGSTFCFALPIQNGNEAHPDEAPGLPV